jgi:hypothetical protein
MTGGDSSCATELGEHANLERDHLPLWKVAALAVAYVQLGPSAALSAAGVIPFSGSAAWLSTLLSVIVMALLAVVIAAFARRWVRTGSLVSYAHEAFGSRARSLVAACLMLGYIALAAAMVAEVVVFTSSALIDLGFPSAASLQAQSGAAILISIVAATCAWRGIDVSVRVVVILGSLCLPFVVVTMAGAFMELHAKALPQLTYFITCAGILRVMRRERIRSLPTAVAAWMSMAAIVYVAVELFRSPVDAGTTYLPYLALATIVILATILAITATSRGRIPGFS